MSDSRSRAWIPVRQRGGPLRHLPRASSKLPLGAVPARGRGTSSPLGAARSGRGNSYQKFRSRGRYTGLSAGLFRSLRRLRAQLASPSPRESADPRSGVRSPDPFAFRECPAGVNSSLCILKSLRRSLIHCPCLAQGFRCRCQIPHFLVSMSLRRSPTPYQTREVGCLEGRSRFWLF